MAGRMEYCFGIYGRSQCCRGRMVSLRGRTSEIRWYRAFEDIYCGTGRWWTGEPACYTDYAFLTYLLIMGIHTSTTVNKILVFVKLIAIFIFLFLAGPSVDTTNWEPFMPFGFAGVSAGAAFIFLHILVLMPFPQRQKKRRIQQKICRLRIIGSLIICTLLYISVTAVMTGNVHYEELDNAEPVAYVLRTLGYRFGSALVGTGAIAGLTTVLLVMMYAQTRAFFRCLVMV